MNQLEQLKSELEKWQLKASLLNTQIQLIQYQGKEVNQNIRAVEEQIQRLEAESTKEE